MPTVKRSRILLILSVITGLAMMGYMSTQVKAFDFAGWDHGGSGYELAYKKALEQEDPLILYFSTDWCGWCKRLNQIYLQSSDVQEGLKDILKVDIDPDKGSAERGLQMKYGIRGYPAFLVLVPALEKRPTKVHPFRSNGMLTTEDFVKAINITIERQYSTKGLALAKERKYEDAFRYFDKALAYFRNDPVLQHNIGTTYMAMAQEEHCSDYLDKAEKSFQAALEIEAGHEAAQNDLKKVQQLLAECEKGDTTASEAEKM